MSLIKSSTTLEKTAGSLATEAALTFISAFAGTPITALLPVLTNSLAAERQKQRVEVTLQEINSILARHESQIASLTDQHYKFINEAVLALLHTTNEHKMKLLKDAVQNSLSASVLPDQEVAFLGRIIRDISAEEAHFLMDNFSFGRIWLNEGDPGESKQDILAVKPGTLQGQIVLGLLTLGLVTSAEPTWDDSGLLRFTPMAAKVIAILKST
ncbi:MAG: hypothetical protein ACXV8W_12660 [Methylobacter sp.]